MKKALAFLGFLMQRLMGIAMGFACIFIWVMLIAAQHTGGILYGLLGPLIVVLMLIVSAACHETGHLLGGLLTGYRFSSIRVRNLILIRRCDGLKLRWDKTGRTLGGQCLMIPPPWQDGKYPFVLYHLGGIVMNLLLGVPALMLYHTVSDDTLMALVLMWGVLNAGSALINGLPIGNCDGLNIVLGLKDRSVRRYFWLNLSVMAYSAQGRWICEMPEELHTVPDDADLSKMDNAYCAWLGAKELIEKPSMDLERAAERIEALAARGLLYGYAMDLQNEQLWLELMGPCRPGRVEELRTKRIEQMHRANPDHSAVIRVRYALALLWGDLKTCRELRAKVRRLARTAPYPLTAEELEFHMDLADQRFGHIPT